MEFSAHMNIIADASQKLTFNVDNLRIERVSAFMDARANVTDEMRRRGIESGKNSVYSRSSTNVAYIPSLLHRLANTPVREGRME